MHPAYISTLSFLKWFVPGPPEPPNNIRVFPNCDRIDVTWDEAVKNGGSSVIGYNIELWRKGRKLISESLPTPSRTKSFQDLESETLYEVRMNSKNAIGEGEWRIVPVNTTMTCKSNSQLFSPALRLNSFPAVEPQAPQYVSFWRPNKNVDSCFSQRVLHWDLTLVHPAQALLKAH